MGEPIEAAAIFELLQQDRRYSGYILHRPHPRLQVVYNCQESDDVHQPICKGKDAERGGRRKRRKGRRDKEEVESGRKRGKGQRWEGKRGGRMEEDGKVRRDRWGTMLIGGDTLEG